MRKKKLQPEQKKKPANKPVVNVLREAVAKEVFGDAAVVVTGIMLVGGGRTAETPIGEKAKTIIAGVVLTDEQIAGSDWERWDCDVVLIPRRKRNKNTIYKGASVDMYLVGGLQDENGWSEEIFPEKKKLETDVF